MATVTSSLEDNNDITVLLTDLHPRPECCVDTDRYGTLVVQGDYGTNDFRIVLDVDSLATLQYQDKQSTDDTDLWYHASLWTSKLNHSMMRNVDPVWLKQHLMDALNKHNSDDQRPTANYDDTDDALPMFIRDARFIFSCLIQVLDSLPANKTTTSRQPLSHWTVENLLELHRQLEELERHYASTQTDVILELQEDLSAVTLQPRDESNRTHVMTLNLGNFPLHVAIDTWNIPQEDDVDAQRQEHKKLKLQPQSIQDVYIMFVNEINKHQELWNQLDDLDTNTWVLEPCIDRSNHRRIIFLTECAKVSLVLNVPTPLSRPTKIQFLGSHASIFQDMYQSYEWQDDVSVRTNLEACFNMSLAKPTNNNHDDNNDMEPTSSTDCGICFDVTTTTISANAAFEDSCACENPKCARTFHRTCLEKWLTSLITSRISFDTIIGNCPYCKDPIAVQMT